MSRQVVSGAGRWSQTSCLLPLMSARLTVRVRSACGSGAGVSAVAIPVQLADHVVRRPHPAQELLEQPEKGEVARPVTGSGAGVVGHGHDVAPARRFDGRPAGASVADLTAHHQIADVHVVQQARQARGRECPGRRLLLDDLAVLRLQPRQHRMVGDMAQAPSASAADQRRPALLLARQLAGVAGPAAQDHVDDRDRAGAAGRKQAPAVRHGAAQRLLPPLLRSALHVDDDERGPFGIESVGVPGRSAAVDLRKRDGFGEVSPAVLHGARLDRGPILAWSMPTMPRACAGESGSSE